MIERVQKVRAVLAQNEVDGLIVSQAENRRYVSGFTGSAGFLFITEKAAVLATDFRYVEQAGGQAPAFQVFKTEGALPKWLPGLMGDLGGKVWGFEAEDVTFATYQDLVRALNPAESGMSLKPIVGLVESLRAVKDADELACIAKAAELADGAFVHAAGIARPGITEAELAWEVERYIREHGGEGLSFDTIIAAGPNGAMPHHRASDRPIQAGEPIVMDLGARYNGYCSDLTRTICLGAGDEQFRQVYDIVLGAQLTAIATLRAGMTGHEIDNLARSVIETAGHAERFGHSLGHGVGLAVHELPRVAKGANQPVRDGMVITIEPGIYLPGWGGVRIEDMAVIENGYARLLTASPKTETSEG